MQVSNIVKEGICPKVIVRTSARYVARSKHGCNITSLDIAVTFNELILEYDIDPNQIGPDPDYGGAFSLNPKITIFGVKSFSQVGTANILVIDPHIPSLAGTYPPVIPPPAPSPPFFLSLANGSDSLLKANATDHILLDPY